jgi:hypothetical protein
MEDKLAAKELALKLRAKAELLESLDEAQISALKASLRERSDGVDSCSFSTPCTTVECFLKSAD